jgi:hypothetical protein
MLILSIRIFLRFLEAAEHGDRPSLIACLSQVVFFQLRLVP